MLELVTAIAVSFGVVFVAELGDKTQLLALNFGSRYSLRHVAAGLVLGYGAASLVAVTVGGVLGANLPQRPIEVVGGVVFLLFALLAVRQDDGDDEAEFERTVVRSSVIATVGLTILVAEMGDKTQLATATLASRTNPVGTWLGATAGEVASGMFGAVAGAVVGERIPTRLLRGLSAALFAAFGVAMLIGWP